MNARIVALKLLKVAFAVLPLIAQAELRAAEALVCVAHSDGSIDFPGGEFSGHWLSREQNNGLRFEFGMPKQAPVRRWFEEESVPIHHSAWQQNGIAYTQSLLVTRLKEGDLMPEGKLPGDAVLLVRLEGENQKSEYTTATAAFGVRSAAQVIPVNLREVFAYVKEGGGGPLAMIDVPSGGLASTNGPVLQFRGDMPPGISGSMIVKIPFGKLGSEEEKIQLLDLDFDLEVRRVKKYWATQAGADWKTIFKIVE